MYIEFWLSGLYSQYFTSWTITQDPHLIFFVIQWHLYIADYSSPSSSTKIWPYRSLNKYFECFFSLINIYMSYFSDEGSFQKRKLICAYGSRKQFRVHNGRRSRTAGGTYEGSSWKPRAESSHLELQAGSGEGELGMAQDFWRPPSVTHSLQQDHTS